MQERKISEGENIGKENIGGQGKYNKRNIEEEENTGKENMGR